MAISRRNFMTLLSLTTGAAGSLPIRLTAATKPAAYGVAVSHHQNSIDWDRFATTHYQWVYIKATGGIDYLDPMFKENYKATKARKFFVGAYHFFYGDDDGKTQAKWFLKHYLSAPDDIPPCIDAETFKHTKTKQEFKDNLLTLVDFVQQQTGKVPVIYTGPNFWNHYVNDNDNSFANYPLWIADYRKNNAPEIPTSWKGWRFWQTTQKAKIAGIQGAMTHSHFNGDLEQFTQFLKKHGTKMTE